MKRASHLDSIQPFHVMALLAEAKALEAKGKSIIHMEVGEPDFESPAPVIAAGIKALKSGKTHYTPATGLPALRQAVSDWYKSRFDCDVEPSRILITPGASGALQLALSAIINPGDKVLLADPGYPCNRNFIHLLHAQPASIAVSADTQFQVDLACLKNSWSEDVRALMLASPSNPTGTIISREEMRTLIDYVGQQQAHVIVDEIYQGLTYDVDVYSSLSLSDDIFVINSFSKFFGMTGWRVGWVVAPEAYVDDLDRLAQNLFLAASTPAQEAALAAFLPETLTILEQRRVEFQRRRDFLVPALRDLGFVIPQVPQGAFYVYADCSAFTDDSMAFCHNLLHDIGVAVTPGADFGDNQPERYVRFAYTTQMDKLEQAVQRLADYLNA